MTREEALKNREECLEYLEGRPLAASVCVEAVRWPALRAYPARLDRSRWEGCEYCRADREGYSTCFRDVNGRPRRMYIPEGEAAIVVPGKYNHKFYIPIKYCPFCGCPLTEEAWAELERRTKMLEEE